MTLSFTSFHVILLMNIVKIKQDVFLLVELKVQCINFAVNILNLVPPPGIEPGSPGLQSGAMTTSAKAAI